MQVASGRLTVRIHLVPQYPGSLENHDTPGSELEVFGCLGVSAPSGGFVLHNKFSEPAHQEVFSFFQAVFYNFEQRFDDRSGLFFAQPYLIVNVSDDVFFSKRHGNPPVRV
jgi:hypothetical protein